MPSPAHLLDRAVDLDRAVFGAINVAGGALLDGLAALLSDRAFGFAWGLALAAAVVLRLAAAGGSRGPALLRAALRPVLAIALAAAASDFLGATVLRPAFGRRRPCYALPEGEFRPLLTAADVGSLPSLHASNFSALALAVTLADRRLGLVAWPVALAVGWSRVYGGVHWPGDVLGGVVWGSLAAIAARAVTRPLAITRS
ncbi:MAG: phosphatase PAP2 family protein [Anaeromyxobacteraceae bacterium]